jgi:hypothetical protein
MTIGAGARGSVVSRVVGAVVAVVGLAALAVGTVHSARATDAQASAPVVAAWRLDLAYYDCLATQAHSLVRPGQTVVVSRADPGAWATLAKVVGPFAVLTDRRPGHVVLTLATSPGPGSCLGSVVLAHDPSGAVRTGTGASLAGHRSPPPTPL